MTKNYDSIDVAKLIAAILIVGLHASALSDISIELNTLIFEGLARLGVPFFFTASAFFFFSRPISKEGTKKYCRRLIILYVTWFLISLPKTIFDRFISSSYPFGITLFRFVRSFFVTSTFSGSWFIVSCIFCACLYGWIETKITDSRVKARVIAVISALAYVWITFTSAYGNLMASLGMNRFYQSYEMIFANPYCSFLVGIPYFAIGRYFAKHAEAQSSDQEHNKLDRFGLSVCLLLLFVEVFLTNHSGLAKATDCYLMLLPCMFFLFPILLRWKAAVKNAKKLRAASTILFFSQFLLLFFCEFCEWLFGISIPAAVKFLFTLLCGLLLTSLTLALQKKRRFTWVRYLY